MMLLKTFPVREGENIYKVFEGENDVPETGRFVDYVTIVEILHVFYVDQTERYEERF